MSFDEFSRDYLYKQPFSAPFRAERFRDVSYWSMLEIIFESGHKECWLPRQGKLPESAELCSGRLSMEQAIGGFQQGRTVLVRHAERVHPKLKAIAEDFFTVFDDPIDIQLYCTPEGEQGFDWHFDLEDVFVIQCFGEKEFWLIKNADPAPVKVDPNLAKDLETNSEGPLMSCMLKAGDWLYIPAGYWHKAKALTHSFHLSVGVMSSRAYGRDKKTS